MATSLIALDDRWGWATEDADPDRLPDTLRRLELASQRAAFEEDPLVLQLEVAILHAEGAIKG